MKRIAALLLCLVLSARVAAMESFVANDIRVQGLQRISPGTVFNYLPIKVGDTVDDQSAQDAIRALFKTGFFSDVRLERDGDVLIVRVTERPSIDSIKIKGTHVIEEDTLKKSLKEIGLVEGRVFNNSVLDRLEQDLKQQYFNRGYYAVKVKPTVKTLPRNRVAIEIDVDEGPVAKIRAIDIVGNHVFSDTTLRKQFTLSTPTLFSFISKNDQYSRQKLTGDLETLRSFYLNRGYLEFDIESTQVSITPDKTGIYITINVHEGKRYTVSRYSLTGKLILPEATLRKLIDIKPGDVFSRQKVTEAIKAISDRLGDEGYAFAQVNVLPDTDKAHQKVAFTFYVDPGSRVYVRRINFFGNNVTRDEVLRREMRQFEGSWYSAEKIRRSVERLRRLGFFEDVTVDTPRVPGRPDQVDVNITVKEMSTGTLMAGIGYSDAEGILLNGSVSFRNLFGTGKELSAAIDTSRATQNININYVNPYYTKDGISRGFNVFSQRIDAANANLAAYNSKTAGAGVFYGIPISEERTINVGLAYERIALSIDPTVSSQTAQDFVSQYGADNNAIKGTLGWTYDSLDSPLFPTHGWLHRVSAEVGLPGGSLEYYRLTYLSGYYYPLSKRTTLKLRGEADYGNGYGRLKVLPFFKNFYAGGSTTVRGYRANSLGPQDPLYTDQPIGGNKRVLASAEVLFPMPGASDSKSMRLSVFSDAGMVYGPGQGVDLKQMRYSAGVAFNWFSPIGPLVLSYGQPLNAKAGDRVERLQFSIGTLFQ